MPIAAVVAAAAAVGLINIIMIILLLFIILLAADVVVVVVAVGPAALCGRPVCVISASLVLFVFFWLLWLCQQIASWQGFGSVRKLSLGQHHSIRACREPCPALCLLHRRPIRTHC